MKFADYIELMRNNGVCHDKRQWLKLCDNLEKAHKAIDSLLAQNEKLVKANETLRLLLKPLVESKITALASAHGTEWGDDPQFDALYNLIDSLQFKYRQLISETPKCSA